jgi:hypothetical protein
MQRTVGEDGFDLGLVALLELDDGSSRERGEHVGRVAGCQNISSGAPKVCTHVARSEESSMSWRELLGPSSLPTEVVRAPHVHLDSPPARHLHLTSGAHYAHHRMLSSHVQESKRLVVHPSEY